MDHEEFDRWNKLKKALDLQESFPPYLKERDIWWASIGKNIGHEQNGKNEKFERPVLLIKKFNKRLFWGVPLTTQLKTNICYIEFEFKKRKQAAMITQLRIFDANRVTRKLGRISQGDFLKNLTRFQKGNGT